MLTCGTTGIVIIFFTSHCFQFGLTDLKKAVLDPDYHVGNNIDGWNTELSDLSEGVTIVSCFKLALSARCLIIPPIPSHKLFLLVSATDCLVPKHVPYVFCKNINSTYSSIILSIDSSDYVSVWTNFTGFAYDNRK